MSPKSPLSTHVLDLMTGKPAAGMSVLLELKEDHDHWRQIAAGSTDADGRLANLVAGPLSRGIYRLTFATGEYFRSRSIESFYPQVTVEFEVAAEQHHHVPLLVSAFGYSTYRGS